MSKSDKKLHGINRVCKYCQSFYHEYASTMRLHVERCLAKRDKVMNKCPEVRGKMTTLLRSIALEHELQTLKDENTQLRRTDHANMVYAWLENADPNGTSWDHNYMRSMEDWWYKRGFFTPPQQAKITEVWKRYI